MTTPEATTAPDAAPKTAPLWEDFIDIFYAPSQVFERRRNANPWPVLLIITALWLVISLVTFDSMATMMETVSRRAMEKAAAQNPQLSQDMMETNLRVGMKIAPWFPLGLPIFALIAAVVIWLVGKLFGSKASYTQSLLITAYVCFTFVISAIVTGAQALLMDMTKVTNPIELSLSAARFADPKQTSTFLYGLLMSLDVFTIWRLILIAVGVHVIGRTSKGAAWGLAALTFVIQVLFGMRTAINLRG
jgi:uncharacterized protein YneF (UPF0154 family)